MMTWGGTPLSARPLMVLQQCFVNCPLKDFFDDGGEKNTMISVFFCWLKKKILRVYKTSIKECIWNTGNYLYTLFLFTFSFRLTIVCCVCICMTDCILGQTAEKHTSHNTVPIVRQFSLLLFLCCISLSLGVCLIEQTVDSRVMCMFMCVCIESLQEPE